MFIEPVFGKKFFGREEVLATLYKRVTALKGGYRQNMALAGPMLCGKSSILRHFLKNINDSTVIPVYIEMDGDDFKTFSTRMMATLLFRYLKSEGLKSEGDFDALKQACRGRIPDTIKCINDIQKAIASRRNSIAYEKLLGLTSVFKTETGKSCIVILDEFHNLANFRLKHPFKTFGKFIMVQKNTMYVVSSSQRTLLKDVLSKKLSLLFGNFEIIDVDGFDTQTARSFVAEKLSCIDEPDLVGNYLIQLTQGSPFYLELLSKRFSETLKKRKEDVTSKEALLEAFAVTLYESDGILNQYFMNHLHFFLEKKSRKKFIPVLLALSHGNMKIAEIQKYLGRQDKSLAAKLHKLEMMDLVKKSGSFYKIADKLFEFWLKNVYSLKTKSMIDDMDIKYLEFKALIEKDFERYSLFSKKSVSELVADLFKGFENEKITICNKDRKMPNFDSVRRRVLSDGTSEVVCYSQNRRWVCHIKQDDIVTEQDINALWHIRPARTGEKIVRKIIIYLKEVDQNAFLLAKEHNIWVWDLHQLNEILRLVSNYELVL